jgi:hypothetical protein
MHGRLLLLWQQLLHGCRCGGCDVGMAGLEQVHPRSVTDRVRGVLTSQDRRPEEHAKAGESAMAAMD